MPCDCLSSNGHLLADKLVVKMAVSAFGGLLATSTTGKVLHNAPQVEVHSTFAAETLVGSAGTGQPTLPSPEDIKDTEAVAASNWLLHVLGISSSARQELEVFGALNSLAQGGIAAKDHAAAEHGMLGKLVVLLGCSQKREQSSTADALWRLLVGEQAFDELAAAKQRGMQHGFAGVHAAVCYVVVQLASSRGSTSSTVEAAAAALCTLAESGQDSQQLFAAVPAACIGLSQLLNSSCSSVQAAAALALADLAAGDDASRQQVAATDGTLYALVRLLNSSSDSVQAAAAVALSNMQQQVSSALQKTGSVVTGVCMKHASVQQQRQQRRASYNSK